MRWRRFLAIAALAVGAVCLAAWLNLPMSAMLFARGLVAQSHPVDFDFEIRDGGRARSAADVELHYAPKTPILGISEHYWSVIAPYRVDTVTRRQHVTTRDGHLRFRAPLALVGLSNFRLTFVTLDGPLGTDNPSAFGLTETESHEAPLASAIPRARVEGGDYAFDGPLALWSMTGRTMDPGGRAYSPLGRNATRQVIWDGLRAVYARIDLAPYPVATFQIPAEWVRYGWRADGQIRRRRDATLTDTLLTMYRGATVTIPFTRDCSSAPEFALVATRDRPNWADDAALWAPVPAAAWLALLRSHRAPPTRVSFVAERPLTADGAEAVRIARLGHGSYRLLGACRNAHYASVAVAWIDVTAA